MVSRLRTQLLREECRPWFFSLVSSQEAIIVLNAELKSANSTLTKTAALLMSKWLRIVLRICIASSVDLFGQYVN